MTETAARPSGPYFTVPPRLVPPRPAPEQALYPMPAHAPVPPAAPYRVGPPGEPWAPPAQRGPVPPPFPPPHLPPAGYEPLLPVPPARRTGPVVGAVIAGLVVLGGLLAGALLLFGPKTLDTGTVEAEVVRLTAEQAGIAPTDVRCPEDVTVQVGGTFSCSATLDGQAVTYSVRQDDEQGNVTISSSGFVVLSRVEANLVQQLRDQADFEATADCGPQGRLIVVGGPGTTIDCTIADAADPADTAQVVGTVTDDQGTVDFRSGS